MNIRYFSLCLILLTPPVLFAQITLTSGTFPSIGDTLRTSVDNLPGPVSFIRSGGPHEWDLSDLEAPYARRTAISPVREGEWSFLFPSASFLAKAPNGEEHYFQRTGNELRLLGRVGYDPLGLRIWGISTYKPARLERRSPVRFQDRSITSFLELISFSGDDLAPGFLDSLPITPDSLRIRILTDRSEVADAFGTLKLKDETYEVLRISRTDEMKITLEARLPFSDWQDISSLLPPNDYFGTKTRRTVHFLSDQNKEALAVLHIDDRGQKVKSIEFKAPLSLLLTDPSIPVGQAGVLAYPNPAIETVRFDFYQVPAGNYRLVLFNILGLPVWERQLRLSGNKTLKVTFSELKKGTYLYSLIDANGKTLSTRRLMIIRP